MLDYAGAELEVDFQRHYGLDIHEFALGGRPWGQLGRLASALPTASLYKNKLLMDPQLAAELDLAGQGDDGVVLDFVDETPVVAALRDIHDCLRDLVWVTVGNPKARPPSPLPRPVSAVTLLQQKQAEQQIDQMVLAITGQAL